MKEPLDNTSDSSDTPDSSVAALSVTVNGLVQSSRSTHDLTTTYACDLPAPQSLATRQAGALGRQIATQDARGASHSRGYDALGRVAWESDPATNGTWYAYDALGRRIAVTNALGEVTHTAYDPEGRVIATWGATYPVAYDYDAHGRMTAMRTFRDEQGPGDETRWLYDEATGLLTNKVYADGKGTAYTYTPDGRLATRAWARGVETAYAYDASGSLTNIVYSDDTPDVAFTYDRLGRMISAVSAVSTNLFVYDGLDLVSETQNGAVISRATDALGRPAGLSFGGSGHYGVSYAYDTFGRFAAVSSSVQSVSSAVHYSRLADSDLLEATSFTIGGSAFDVRRSYEPLRSLVTSVENAYGETAISRYAYENDALGRRTAITRSGMAFADMPVHDAYGYNPRSEVVSARRTPVGSPTELRGFSYDYEYDPIGNRVTSTEYDHEGDTLVSAYAANALNQYEQRTVPGYAGVRGTADTDATVTVNANPAWRWGEYFYGGDAADNSLSAIMKELEITAVYSNLFTSVTGRVFVARTPESFTYDDDGNLTRDGRFDYTWDAENRLIGAITRDDLPASFQSVKVEYAYDHQGRRIASGTSIWTNDTWQAVESRAFLYDGWNVVTETIQDPQSTITNHYVWGLDLSGSLHGAGGIGGLLAASLDGTTAFYCHDANGNVGQLVDADSAILARYEYSPFGETVVSTGPLAKANPFRFSTKWFDNDTGLGYWGYRWYSPGMGRWMNRDPIEENGGSHLYTFCVNNSINTVDAVGYSDKMLCSSAAKYFKKGYSTWDDPEWANFKDRAKKMQEMGCKLSVGCDTSCDAGGTTRSTSPKKISIRMCHKFCERRKWSDWLDVLRHEFSHAYDHCLNNGGFPCFNEDAQINPRKICTEIRAYINGSIPPPPSKESVISSACGSIVKACWTSTGTHKDVLRVVCEAAAEQIYDTCSSLEDLAPVPVILPIVPTP